MIITVGGLIGSGKTTLAKRLAEAHNLKYISIGSIMRTMAEEQKLSLEEFSKIAEKTQSVDKKIEDQQKKLATKNCVVDSRLGAFLLKSDLRIWLTAPLETRAKRVSQRENIDFKRALVDIEKREKSERQRYKEFYNIDLSDLTAYDLVLNTEYFNPDEMFDICNLVVSLR